MSLGELVVIRECTLETQSVRHPKVPNLSMPGAPGSIIINYEMGRRDLLVTQNISQPSSNHCSVRLTRSVRRRAASFSRDYRNVWSAVRRVEVPSTRRVK